MLSTNFAVAFFALLSERKKETLNTLTALHIDVTRWREVRDSSQSFSSDTLQGISSE